MSLSKDEAIGFLKGPLGLSDAERKLSQDRVAFLDDVIVAFHRHLPFQTISNMAVRPEERDVPTWEEVKEDMFRGRGGKSLRSSWLSPRVVLLVTSASVGVQ